MARIELDNDMANIEYNPQHINYALVEGVRPPMYKAMKYWGRKPHNIWSDYINHYCPEGGIVLDPFVGSGIAAFESLKLGRKAIATDLNPLSMFVIETLTAKFDEKLFKRAVENISQTISNDNLYKVHYTRTINGKSFTVYNYIWERGVLKFVRLKNENNESLSLDPSDEDNVLVENMNDIKIPYWYPRDKFPNNPSINQNFIDKIGGTTFDNLWTRRNLYLLSLMFDLILKEDSRIQLQLMYAFIHTLHLVCKMVVPRGEAGNRDFSGSWGRADYMIRSRQMEQNPLIVFLRSCFDKQGVLKAMLDASEQLPAKRKIHLLNKTKRINLNADINYGVLDVADLTDYLDDNSVDFVLTDPPYGGLVQYMDLSMVWLVWLQHFNPKYTPDSSGEITYKPGITSRQSYKRKLVLAFKNLYRVLKPGHYMVVTFHNQDIREWNDFVGAIRESGFVFEKVTHQYNKRSGESNVSNPYGTTGSDFYIRCRKDEISSVNDEKMELYRFVIHKTVSILAERAEPTPFTFILNGLLPDMLQAGYLEPDAPAEEIMKILKNEIGANKTFTITKNEKDQSGDILWFANPSAHINHMSISLTDRVDLTIKNLLRRRVSVKYDDIVAEIFKEYPNGQTPDPCGIINVVEKYATKSNAKWKLKDEVERDCTEHTHVISQLCSLAKKAKMLSFVGKREQREYVDDTTKLVDIASLSTLDSLLDVYQPEQLSRIEMIDMLWISENKIASVFEVENSTDFIGAIARSSCLPVEIPKFMIVPERRMREFLNFKDPLFVQSFKDNNWRYCDYRTIQTLDTTRAVTLKMIQENSKDL